MSESMSHEEFFEAFEGEDGYQTGTEEVEEDTNEGNDEIENQSDEITQEGVDAPQSGKSEDGAAPGKSAEESTGGQQAAETFTLKVNKEERTVSREEMITLAQKGADYDRIKEAAEQAKTDNTALKEQNAKMQEAYDILTTLAEESKVSIPELLDVFRINRYKGQGLSEDAAKERVAREKAERELKTLKSEQAAAQAAQQKPDTDRAKRDLEEFRKAYPDVALTKELVDSMLDDVQAGMTLTQAYQKQEAARKDEKIRQLEAELEAERKNRENRASSPGPQKDSGAKRSKSQYDDFFGAFND